MTKVLHKTDVLEAEVGDDLVILNPDTLVYFEFNEVGQRIWQLLNEGPRNVSDIVELLMGEYEVEADRCLTAVEEFIAAGTSKGLLRLEEV